MSGKVQNYQTKARYIILLKHMLVEFEQTCLVQTAQSFTLFDKEIVNQFVHNFNAILEDVSEVKTIV